MSVGNLQDSGSRSTNFPWQLKVLEGLQQLIDSRCCDDLYSILSDINDKLTPSERQTNIISVTGAGSTPIGVYSFSVANVGSANGVINAVNIPAGVTINFDGGAMNNTLSPIVYNATGTTFIITYIS